MTAPNVVMPSQIVMRATASLIGYARNSRTHDERQIAVLAKSITEYGFTNPILIDGDRGVIAGHGRIMAAEKLGLVEVPCIELRHLTNEQKRAYLLADNAIGTMSGWNEALLAQELADLSGVGIEATDLGFDAAEVDRLMETLGVDFGGKPEGDPDAVPEAPVVATSKLGDVWLLGQHRVMCGDSTDRAQVERLMHGKKADMVFTDPPYNVAYSSRGEANQLGGIENDDMDDDSFNNFLDAVFDAYLAAMQPLAPIYVCHPGSRTAPKLAFERSFGERFHKASTIIWVKQSAGMGWQDYRAQHEPIIYGWKKGEGKHYYCGDRAKTTVWQIGRDAQASYVHPTQKPVELPAEAIENSSKKGQVVLDLFGGSGSTLIACEKTERINRSMELDSKFCDVIVRRWQDFTGKAATLDGDGRTFAEIEEARRA